MSSQDPAVLLPDVMSRVANLDPPALTAVHRFLIRLELAQCTGEIEDEAEALLEAGKLEADLIDAAVCEHRKDHPYAG